MGSLLNLAMRAPKLLIVLALLLLVVLATISTVAGYHVIGMISIHLGIGRFLAGLLLATLFARLPRIRNGKISTIGLLPKVVRLPAVLVLLGGSLVYYITQQDLIAALFIGLATTLLLAFRWLRQMLVQRFRAAFTQARPDPSRAANDDASVIDVDFRERKD